VAGQNSPSASSLERALRPFIGDERVLAAVLSVPRERFVEPGQAELAYDNVPLPIGCGQTISQPLVVARMCELLAPGPHDVVLDIGTGSGYHAAVLAQLSRHVWSVERHRRLSRHARQSLRVVGIDNVTLIVGDGSRGLPEQAPFDAINVAAAARGGVPRALEHQLADGGRLVAPVQSPSPSGEQRLVLVRRRGEQLRRWTLEPVRFVPLVG
jgi:protein-L-isoaspartate(D-aspartate) O-methyltransferase